MPTPCKPITMIKNEKKSHRTKAEIKQREQAEKSLQTGNILNERDEVKENPIAHKEFLRLKPILESIEKNDALFEGIINRYCLLTAECLEFENKILDIESKLKQLGNDYSEKEIDAEFYYSKLDSLTKTALSYDRQLQTKRKMLFDIEKENIMTIASALRSIPKKVEEKENPLLKALNG